VSAPKYEVADVLKVDKQWQQSGTNAWQRRTLYALTRCRTAAMGGHIDQCNNPSCAKLHISYNSCRNRHCPKCQGHLSVLWMQKRQEALLNTSYFHVVFTLPHTLNPLALSQPKAVYGSLFKAAWATLQGFAANPKFLGAKTGMTAVLHTWGQNLSLHPHLHCIVPAGGITVKGKWKNSKSKGTSAGSARAKYLFPVKALSKVFRAKYVDLLSQEITLSKATRNQLFAKPWVVYTKQPFFGPNQVVEYLGRYTHKIAISNHRLKSLTKQHVSFSYKDYRQGGKKKVMTLATGEFIRRFAQHILPKGFTRIRHYGILASGTWRQNKELTDSQLGAIVIKPAPEPLLHRKCPACKKGDLETLVCFDNRGPPEHWLTKLKKQRKMK